METLPEGFRSWDEYDAYRKATGPSMRSAYPNKFTEFIATNPLTNFLVPGAEKFLQRGGSPSAFDIGLGALDVATGPLPAGAMLGSVVKKLVSKPKKYRPHKYAGLSFEEKAPLILKEFPQIVDEGLTYPRAIAKRGAELRKELPRVGGGKRLVRTLKARKDRAEATATAESIPSNLSPRQAHERAASRTRKTIDNLRKREFEGPSGGKSYWLTEADEKELYDQLYPIKLREVLEGTPHGRRMTISHHYPSLAALTRGGEQVGSGFANLANLTDEFGNFRFLTRSENASLGKVVPEIYLSTIKNLLNLK